MRKIHGWYGVLSLVLFSGCAVGPLVSHETARTVGSGNSELILGYGQASYVVKFNLGLMESLDLGVQVEELSIGARLKYAFINQRENGFSLAAAVGAGASLGGNHYYGDLLASYLAGSWEPYATFRFVHVVTDELKSNDGFLDFTVRSMKYNYSQIMFGTRYWLSEHWLLSLEISTLLASDDFSTGKSFFAGGAIGYRF